MVEGTSQSLSVHRCRFVDYTPSPIGAIAFPPLPLPNARDTKKKKAAGTSQTRKFGTLAVGRANGNIELCEWSGPEYENQAPQAWTIFKILYGPKPSKVDSLVFTLRYPYQHSYNEVPALSDLRLFSAGGGSELVEWDLSRGTILRTISSQGGAIWSMAANPSSNLLALGCDDGSIRLLSLEHDSLSHYRHFDRVKCRILSIAWGPPIPPQKKEKQSSRPQEKVGDGGSISGSDEDSDNDDEEWSDSWIVTGCSDSCVRKWDINSGRVVDRMTTDRVRGEKTLVWAVGVVGDGTIVSGDSLGTVKFWDSRTCTQSFSFQSHGADVLCLAIGPDGDTVFTSGVDQKVCLFSHVKISKSNKNNAASSTLRPSASNSRWVLSTSKRMHSHDVRTLAVWPPYLAIPPSTHRSFPSLHSIPSPFIDISPILASGGMDASVVLAPCASASSTVRKIENPLVTSVLSNFEDAYHRRMAYTTGSLNPAIHVAKKKRLVVSASENKVGIWRVLGKPQKLSGENPYDMVDGASATLPQDDGPGFEKLLDMELDVTTNISASAISDDGHWLAISDVYEIKLFELPEETGTTYLNFTPRRVKAFMSILQPHLPKSSSNDLIGGSNGLPTEGASVLGFTPDSTRLIVATSLSASVIIVDLTTQPLPQVLRRFDHHRRRSVLFGGRVIRKLPRSASGGQNGIDQGQDDDEDQDDEGGDEDVEMKDAEQKGDEEDIGSDSSSSSSSSSSSFSLKPLITRLTTSLDCQWLATTDTLNRTHIFSLDGVSHHTSLPTAHSSALAISFAPPPAPPGTLLLVHADHSLSVFDVETKRTPEWAEKLDKTVLPKRFTNLQDPVLGIAFDWDSPPSLTATKNESNQNFFAIFWSATWLCRVELGASADFTGGSWGGFSKKRPRDKKPAAGAAKKPGATNANAGPSATAPTTNPVHDEETNFKVVTRYRPLLFSGFLGANELLVIERPLIDVLAKLPPAFFKAKYGS